VEIRRFQPVALLVSRGPQLFPVPQLVGITLDQAKNTLNATGMALGKVVEKYDERAGTGTVLSQDPSAATPAKRGTPVQLVVSKGPEPIAVPSVVGKDQDAAEAVLEAAGLKAEAADDEVFSDKIAEGSVVSQTPANGTLPRGGTVTLTISKGPRMIEVPSFIGKPVDEARKALEALGFKVKVDRIFGGLFGTVRDQDPVDTEVPEGSVITLTVV
jgi:beta-lactam-binding protein with PASTA domain